jgi:acetylornithine deacetylase
MDKENLRRRLWEFLPQAKTLLLETIACPSISGNEADVQALLDQKWQAAGFHVQRHPVSESIKSDPEYAHLEGGVEYDGRDNLEVCIEGENTGRSLIINSHVDVVPPHRWPEAFEPKTDGEWIFGRGACDAKGCVATMYLAACAMKTLGIRPAGDVSFQMVIEEEAGGNGSLARIRQGSRADGVVVLEPTNLVLHPANRGAIWFRFEFEGKPCHMGRKEEGVNAIDLARETIDILYKYEQELTRDRDDQPLFAHYRLPAQVNIGILRAGELPSIVAGSAVMEGGIGFLPNRSMAQVKEDVVRRIEEQGSEALKARYRLTFPRLHNDSFETPVDHPLVQTFHAATQETEAGNDITGWNVSCDARLFSRIGKMPTVVFGPGRIEDAHSAAERIHMPDMVTAAETLIRFVEKWCIPV